MPRNPHVAITIVNYKGKADTLECLASLRRLTYPNFNVLVVDQASGDGTPHAIRQQFPEVIVVESPVNDGFAGGNNRGAAVALGESADYLFFLNNDTIVAPDLLEPLVEYAEANSQVGVAGSRMFFYDSPDTIWSDGGRMTGRGDSEMIDQGRVIATEDAADAPFAVDFVVGCGLLVRRSVWEAVGAMDAEYFLYYEEADLCAQVRRAGGQVVTVPRSRLWHKVSRSTGGSSDLTLYYMRRNVIRYLRRCAHRPTVAVLRSVADTMYLATVFALRGERRRARVLGWALMDALWGRWGKTERF